MKLMELKPLEAGNVDLKEGVIPVHISMTLEQIKEQGKISNNLQASIVAGLVDMFKGGGPSSWPRNLNVVNTTTDMLNVILALSEHEQVTLVSWLQAELIKLVKYETDPPYVDAEAKTDEWIRKWTLQKQD